MDKLKPIEYTEAGEIDMAAEYLMRAVLRDIQEIPTMGFYLTQEEKKQLARMCATWAIQKDAHASTDHVKIFILTPSQLEQASKFPEEEASYRRDIKLYRNELERLASCLMEKMNESSLGKYVLTSADVSQYNEKELGRGLFVIFGRNEKIDKTKLVYKQ